LSAIYGTLAYPTDYPNFWDRNLGRGGYGIWMHGIDKPLVDYDSNGCIELENADIARLEDILKLFDTPMITYETLALAPVEELKREGRAVRGFLEEWRLAWSGKDHAAYRAKYAPEFVNSDNRGFAAWMTHKENVARNYRVIKVELKDVRVYRHRDVVAVVFEQDYQGDQRFHSVGIKRLYLRPEGGGYKIVGEEFRPRPRFDDQKRLTSEEKRLALTTPPKVAPQVQEPEGSRAAVEARAAAEDQVRAGAAPDAQGEEGPPVTVAEVRGSLTSPSEPGAPEAAEPAPPVEVQPPRAGAAERNRFFADLVGDWARVWALKDQEAYFAFYHPDFHYRAKDMDLAAFRIYRSELMKGTGRLEVRVSDFEIQNWGDRVRVAFRQDYLSDQLRDRGRKTLVFKRDGTDWKILSETWRGVTDAPGRE